MLSTDDRDWASATTFELEGSCHLGCRLDAARKTTDSRDETN